MIYEKLNQGSRSPLHTSPLCDPSRQNTESTSGMAQRLATTRQNLVKQLKERFPGLPF